MKKSIGDEQRKKKEKRVRLHYHRPLTRRAMEEKRRDNLMVE